MVQPNPSISYCHTKEDPLTYSPTVPIFDVKNAAVSLLFVIVPLFCVDFFEEKSARSSLELKIPLMSPFFTNFVPIFAVLRLGCMYRVTNRFTIEGRSFIIGSIVHYTIIARPILPTFIRSSTVLSLYIGSCSYNHLFFVTQR